MNVRRGGLGRGLGALIPTGPEEEELTGARFDELPIDSISPNPRQPREVFDEDALAELVASIRAVGVLQPVVVRETEPGRYQLIMGERRWRASRQAGLDALPAIIRDTPDDALLRDALLENLHRQQLNPLEEAAAYQQLLTEFGTTHEELADRIGRSRSHVSNTLRLLNLTPAVQRRVAAGVLSAGHARALLALPDEQAQDKLASRVIAEGLSVRAVEEIVSVSEEARPERAPRQRTEVAAEFTAVAELLSEQLETRVTVEPGRRRGRLVIEFAGAEDLQRIFDRMTVTSPAVPTAQGDGRSQPENEPGASGDGQEAGDSYGADDQSQSEHDDGEHQGEHHDGEQEGEHHGGEHHNGERHNGEHQGEHHEGGDWHQHEGEHHDGGHQGW